jgi:hypothetical protein
MPTFLNRKLLLGLVASGGLVTIAMLTLYHPGSLMIPPCPTHWLTGLYCPGCGSLRATHHLLQGDLLTALRFNGLAILLLPALGWMMISESLNVFGQRGLPNLTHSRYWIFLLLIAVGVFTLLRNLPIEPFVFMAPAGSGLN